MFENDKLPLRKKIVLSLGLLVAALILIIAQYSGIKAKSDNDAENNMIKKESIQPGLNEWRDIDLNDSSNNRGKNKKYRSSEIPIKNTNTNNRIFESI